MPESEPMMTIDTDDEMMNSKDMELSTTSNFSKTKRTRLTFPFGACRVCSDSATGIHYGIATCEGCKGFFKRSILRKEKYRCYFDNTCIINVTNRNRCKACRFRRCIGEGMSVDGVKMGRIPKLVKERALKELKEQKLKEEATLAEPNDQHPRTSSCSSTSDRSIENYDPNPMETDFVEFQVSPIQRNGDLANTYTSDHLKENISSNLPNVDHSVDNKNTSIIYRTKYPTFLPDDFTANESEGITEQTTGLLKDEVLKHVKTIANKLSANQSNSLVELNEDETTLIRYLRWSAYNIFLRRSKRLKQLISRMNQMIENHIQEYPGDDATLSEFHNSIRLSCEVYTPSFVLYIQELPGLKNIGLNSLQKMIAHRLFDWFLIKYHELYNENGECYFLGPNGFQHTRYWMNQFHGKQLAEAMFHFCQCLRELHLNESELSLVLPLHVCYFDSTMEDQEMIRMLRSCYLHALYSELRHNRDEDEAKIMCSRILQTLKLLIPMTELYQKEVASRTLDV